MSDFGKKITFSDFFSEGQFETQVETLDISKKKESITIGIPLEITAGEYRVPLVPNSIRTLIGYGHQVLLESGAGDQSKFSDHDFSEAGAQIVHSKEEIFKCSVILKVAPPTLEEIDLFTSDQVLISPLHFPVLSQEYLQKLKQKRVTAIAMEYLQAEDGSYPVVRIVSEIAGMQSILTAADLLSKTKGGRGTLLGGISGIPPSKVVILGAGVVGEFATKTALGLGASVRVFDNDIAKLMRLQSNVGRQLHTSVINPVYLGYQLVSADVVVGAFHSKTGRVPIIVTEEMIKNMKEGAVIIDISIDQGGVFETSEMTTLERPTFVKHGVIHHCVPNIASKVSRTGSIAISNVIMPLLLRIGSALNIESLLYEKKGIRNGVYMYKTCLTNEYLSKRFKMKYTSLDLLLTSKF